MVFTENKNTVPQWILDSTTGIGKQNDEVGLIVAGFIGAFRKRGFSEKQIGSMMSKAFLLPLEEMERRIDSVLSCASAGEEEKVKDLCVLAVSKGHLFNTQDTDPVEIIEILKEKYGKVCAFETILTMPELLSFWKRADVRDSREYRPQKEIALGILEEVDYAFSDK